MNLFSSKSAGVFIVAMCLGFGISLFSWDGLIYYFEFDPPRVPASIKERFNLTKLSSERLWKSKKKILLKNSMILKKTNETLIEVGHFAIMNKNKHRSVCNHYENIILTFSAFGMTTSTDTPKLSIHTPCRLDKDKKTISSVLLPTKEILKTNVTSQSFTINEEQIVYFYDVYDEWPLEWELNNIIFENDQDPEKKIQLEFLGTKNNLNLQLH